MVQSIKVCNGSKWISRQWENLFENDFQKGRFHGKIWSSKFLLKKCNQKMLLRTTPCKPINFVSDTVTRSNTNMVMHTQSMQGRRKLWKFGWGGVGEASSIVVGIICPNPFGIGLTKPPKSGGLTPFSTAVRYIRAAMIGKPPQGLGLAWILQNRKRRRQWWYTADVAALPAKNWPWRPCM